MVFKNNSLKHAPSLAGWLICLLAYSCAQIASPEGGPRDVEPPKILKSDPGNFSTQFNKNEMKLTFDEYVLIKDPSQIIISPLVENPEFNLSGKSITVKFDSLLEPHTTYTINFNNAIVDLNEGNVLDNNLFVFSTGAELDSLTFSGRVESAFEQTPVSNIYVFLYKLQEDSAPYNSKPYYLTKTSATGNFVISNIKEGTYKAFALKDTNNNLLYDQPSESIAYKDTPIVIKENMSVNFRLFQEESERQYVKSSRLVKTGHVTIAFAKKVEDLQVDFLEAGEYIITEPHGKDSISFWITDTIVDTLKVVMRDEGIIIDTVELSVKKRATATARGKGGSTSSLVITVNADSTRGLSPKDTLRLSFSQPVKTVDEDKIVLHEGQIQIPFKMVFTDRVKKQQQLIFDLKTDSLYRLYIPDSTFTDIFGLTNDSFAVVFKRQVEDYYGKLKLTLTIPEADHQFILILKEGKGTKTKEAILKKDRVATFKDLDPGNYTLTLIYDENNNGKWDTGSYLKKRQPEKVIRYTGQVIIRSNWEQELEWKVDSESDRRLIKGQKER